MGGGNFQLRIILPIIIFLLFLAYLTFALPSVTYVSPTLSDNSTTGSNWVFINLTSSEPLNQSLLEWGNASGFTNVSMGNSSLANWYINMTSLADRTYNYTIFAQNTTGDWNQTQRRFVYIDTTPPYSLYACQDLTIAGGSYILMQNVSSSGTCFNVLANNLTLDGQGYTINYTTGTTAGYAINNSGGYDNITIKNLNIVQGNASVTAAYVIYGFGMANSTITNNSIKTSDSYAHGIYLYSSSNSNTLSNNTITTSNAYAHGIYLQSSNSNNITGGSAIAKSASSYDYYLDAAGATNNFTNTNFTASRRIYFKDNSSYFNYNNQTSGNIWLKTNILNASSSDFSGAYLTRTLINWNNTLMKWNDTNSTANITANYTLTGLLASTQYKVYNTSAGTQTNPYSLTTGSSGSLNFNISLNGNMEIIVNTTAGIDFSPVVSALNYPSNNSNFTTGTLWLNATGYDDLNLTRMELNVWNSTSLVNQTNITNPANNTIVGLQVTLVNGTYKWNYRAYDNASQTGWYASNYTFTIDGVPPTSNSPNDASYSQGASATIGWILYDNYVGGNYTVYRNGTSQNQSAWQNNTNLNVWVNTSAQGAWNYTIAYNDSLGNNGVPDTVMITITGNTAPQWLSNSTKLSSPQSYSAANNYGFQINWTDSNFDNATFQLGRPSGALTNYTKSASPATNNNTASGPNVWYINFTQDQLGPVGTYNYTWFGIDTQEAQNKSDAVNYVINQATPSLSVGDLTAITYGTATQTGCQRVSGDASSTLTLYRNGTSVATGTTSPINETSIVLGAAVYNYTCTISATENFTSGTSANNYRTVNKAATSMRLFLNGTEGNNTYVQNQAANFTAQLNISRTITLRSNYTGFVDQTGTQTIFNYTNLTQMGTNFNLTAFWNGDENYTASQKDYFFNMTAGDITPPQITFVSPTWANNSQISENWEYVNVTLNEQGNVSLLEWSNGTLANYTMQGSGTNFYRNMTNQNGTITYRVYANDSAGNMNVSETRVVTLNTTSSSSGWTNNYTNNNDTMFLVSQGTSIEFTINKSSITSCQYLLNKVNQTTGITIGSSNCNFIWAVPSDNQTIWEIYANVTNSSGSSFVEWVVTNMSLSEAPAVFDYFADGKLTSRTETDPWGRPISNWQNWYGSVSNYENSQYYMTSTDGDNSGMAISLPNAVKYGTWKFRVYHTSREWNTVPGYAFNLKADNSANSNGLYYAATPDTHRYMLWKDNKGDFTRPDEDRGYWFTNAVLWHNYTVIVTRDGWIYDFIDGTLGQVWNIEDPEKPFGAITETSPPTYYTHTPMGNTQGFSLSERPSYRAYFDNLEIYNETYLFPDSRIVYDKFIDYWGPQNASYISPAIKSPAIIIRKMNTTLSEINTAINNPSLFTYNSATRTATSYTNITVGDAYGIGELVLDNETLLFSPSSNGNLIFSLYQGSRLIVNNSRIDSNNNYYWKWRITSTADTTGYPPSMLEWDPSWWQIITNGASHVFLGSLEIYNSTVNNSANFWVSSPYIMKIRDSEILNLHADKHGSFTGNYPTYVSQLKGYWNFDKTFAWDSNYYHLSKFDFTNITFSIAPDSSNSEIILIQNDELFNKLNLYNLNLDNATLKIMKPIKVNTALTVPLKYYNGRTALVNSKWKDVNITTDRAEFVPKYYLDVEVVNGSGSPVSGAIVNVTNEVNENYPAENITNTQWFFDDLYCTNSPSYCWTTGTGNYHYGHKIVTYNYNDGRIRYSENAYMPRWNIPVTTDSTGHTPLPAFPSNSLVIPDYSQNQSSQTNFTYTINVTYAGKNASITGVNPNETWYRSNPRVPNITVKCNIDAGTCALVSPEIVISVSLTSPSNNLITNTPIITFNCSASSINPLVNITLYGNWSGWGAKNSTNITGTSNSSQWVNTLSDGSYKWNCLAYDNTGNSSFAASNYTFTIDTTPPMSITNLANQSQSDSWIYWNWTNPADSDFNHTEVWLNGTFQQNISANNFNATGLNANTWYRIETRTVDNAGNINTTWVNSSAKTLPSCRPPSLGMWNVSNREYCKNTVLTINGSVNITSQLVLENTTLNMSSPSNWDYNIIVFEGGKLIVNSSSILSKAGTGDYRLLNYGNFTIKDSSITSGVQVRLKNSSQTSFMNVDAGNTFVYLEENATGNINNSTVSDLEVREGLMMISDFGKTLTIADANWYESLNISGCPNNVRGNCRIDGIYMDFNITNTTIVGYEFTIEHGDANITNIYNVLKIYVQRIAKNIYFENLKISGTLIDLETGNISIKNVSWSDASGNTWLMQVDTPNITFYRPYSNLSGTTDFQLWQTPEIHGYVDMPSSSVVGTWNANGKPNRFFPVFTNWSNGTVYGNANVSVYDKNSNFINSILTNASGYGEINITFNQSNYAAGNFSVYIKNQTGDELKGDINFFNDTVDDLVLTATVQDTTSPNIVVLSPLNQSYTQKWVWSNATLNEAGSWCGVSLNNTSNQTLSNTSTTAWYLNLSVPSEGSNNVKFYCNDTAGNMGNSSLVYFSIDTIKPTLTFVNTTPNNSATANRWAYINITSSEQLSTALLEWNGTAPNLTMSGSGTNWYYNKTPLTNGNYTFRVFANDTVGNWNSTETRWVYVNWTAQYYRYNFTIQNKTGGGINATIKLYNDSATELDDYSLNSSYQSKWLDLEEERKYHIRYSLTGGQTLTIRNLTISANTTINPQFVDSYSGTLPSDTAARSYSIAFNDTGLSFYDAEITLPLSGTANRILHCLSWSYASASCSSWESSLTSAYNGTFNSTHFIFNITSFDSYMAGYYEAPSQQQQSTSSGGGGGGGGGAITTAKSITATPAGMKIIVNLKQEISSPSITVAQVSSIQVSAPSEPVYQYINITKNNFNNSQIENATIEFKVNKSWILTNNITSVYLARYENVWNRLKTELANGTGAQNVYKAYTDKFSYFAIVGENISAEQPAKNITEQPINKTSNITSSKPYTQPSGFNLDIVVALVVLVAGLLSIAGIYEIRKKIKTKKKRKYR